MIYVVITVIIEFIIHAMLSVMVAINFYKIHESCYCINCTEENFPFCHTENKKNNISKSLSKPSLSLTKLINQLNKFTDETKDYDENLPKCKYRDFGYFQNI